MTAFTTSHSPGILGSLSGLAIGFGVASLVVATLIALLTLFSLRRAREVRLIGAVIAAAIAGSAATYFAAGGAWAVVGAFAGVVTGWVIPSISDGLRGRQTALQQASSAEFRSVARLLDPRQEIVGFIGRRLELADLQAWCAQSKGNRLRLVTGPGGVGKTRLALKFGEQMRELGWKVEIVPDGQEGRIIEALRTTVRQKTLLIVDYAETRVELEELLTELTGENGKGLRLLLLARSSGEWWDRLRYTNRGIWDMLDEVETSQIALSPVVASDVSDVEILTQAISAFAKKLAVPRRAVHIDNHETGPMRILELHTAALIAVLDQSGTGPINVDIRTVFDSLLGHEKRFWHDSARRAGIADGKDAISPLSLSQVVAAACLLGAATEPEAHDLLRRVPGVSPSTRVARWLRDLYPPEPGQEEWLGTLHPERLAELHTVRELAGSSELASSCLSKLDERQARRAVMLLARASSDDTEAENLLLQAVPRITRFISDIDAPLQIFIAIYNAIPLPTVTLATVAVAISERIIDELPTDTPPAVRAYWLSELGVRLREIGRAVEALRVMQEAVGIRRELATTDPGQYGPALASSLDNLGACLSDLGRTAEALEYTQQAVRICRGLAEVNPDRYRPDLAASMTNLGIWVSKLGHPVQALPVMQEAVSTYRELAEASPDVYLPDLASSLDNLGTCLSDLGRRAEALEYTEQAVRIRRELAEVNPDRYRPDLAASLDNLGSRRSELGRPTEALPVIQEAVSIRRELAAANPDRYRPDLAASLTTLSAVLFALGGPTEALPVIQEAVSIRRELAAANPDRYRAALSSSLANLDVVLSALGRPTEALPVIQEAVSIRRELAAANPDRYRAALASSLTSLGNRFFMLGRPNEAALVIQEAVHTDRELAVGNPDRYRPDLAASLSSLGVVLSALSRPAEALAVTQEAVDTYRDLAAANPQRYRPELARSLTNLSIWYSELRRLSNALEAIQEGVGIYRDLTVANPQRYRPDLAASLAILGNILSALSRPTEALAVMQEAVAMFRQLTAASPGRFRSDLASSLANLADVYAALNRSEDASSVRIEAEKMRQQF